mmetsp:Transcript_40280/g.51908  ORF Transcript_40280/g.51908 Transcript_40280/m.51908 type:complete len:139 (-) Transcript_40280:213-629(-)
MTIPIDVSMDVPWTKKYTHVKTFVEDIKRRIEMTQQYLKDISIPPLALPVHEFQPGDKVLVYKHITPNKLKKKLYKNWQGPYTVQEKVGEITYKVTGHTASVRADKMKLYYTGNLNEGEVTSHLEQGELKECYSKGHL